MSASKRPTPATSKKPSKPSPKKTQTKSKFVPFRDLEKDGVTYSFLSQFLQCRESARLSYVEGWTQAGVIDALEFGSMFHLGIETIAKGADVDAIKPAINAYIAKRRNEFSQTDLARMIELQQMVLLVYPLYHEYWKREGGDEFTSEFVSQEEDFAVEHKLPSGRKIKLRGRYDGIFRKKGKLWLMENKTKSQIDEEGLSASLKQDLQTMIYCHTIRQKYGETPAGILYNVIRRPGQRQKKDESYPQYLQRVAREIRKEPDHYFMRWNISMAPNDVANWVTRSLNPVLEQVCLWWDEISQNPFDPWAIPNRIHHFTNPEGLYTRYGRSHYFELLTRGSHYGLTRRSK